jgi:DNA-binding winged helix-turn-helix (wHTH) protein
MLTRAESSSVYTFGDYQLDCRAGELKKRGRKLRVQQQPVHILSLLVAAAGDVVTREELREAVWAQHTHVDFDRAINKAINRLRQVLGDMPERPRFIETVPRRGYRFLAAVTRITPPLRAISPEVRETLLKARHFSGKRTVHDLNRAVDYFRQTIEHDPNCGDAWAGLAEAHVVMGIFGLRPPHDAFPSARAAAEKALVLNGSSAQAHTVLADVRKFYDWDWSGAEHAYHLAIDYDPHCALAHQWYAQLLAMQARHKEALVEMEAARQCDPVSPVVNGFISYIHLEARQYDHAVIAALRAMELDSAAPLPYFLLGRAYVKVGEFQRAIDALAVALQLAGNVPRFKGSLGYAYARAGRHAEAEAILDHFSGGPLATVASVERAMISLGLGATDVALTGLEEAYAARRPGVLIAGDPFFSELAGERRYQELMSRLRLPVQG